METIKALALAFALLLAYLLLWPVPIDPIAWTPPPLPPATADEHLRGIQRIEAGSGAPFAGPEALTIDARGRLYTGLHDGRLLSFAPDFSGCSVVDQSDGRPLGLAATADGHLLMMDARRGLMSLAANGELRTLSEQADGKRFGFPDDVAVTADGAQVYFTDASTRFGYGQHMEDLFEHGRSGRLLHYDAGTGQTTTLLQNLAFANGVALGPDESYLLINETWEYRITRYWLKGERAGQTEVFADNLPGFPDNLSFNGRDRFWVALYSPRDPLFEALLPHPFLRRIVLRLPEFLRRPRRVAHVIAFDLAGKVVADLADHGADAYAPITSVVERDGWLYFGSLSATALGRLPLPAALAPEPPVAASPLRLSCT